jgi:excisionase family DNA binding protein
MNKHAYSVDEAARLFSLSRSKLYELKKAGLLRFHKIGRRTLIFHADLMALVGSDGGRVGETHG